MFIKYRILFVLALLLINYCGGAPPPSTVNGCTELGCEAYECWDRLAQCGENGYLRSFATKYCQHFLKTEVVRVFDAIGQATIECARPCLIEAMRKYLSSYGNSTVDCSALETRAYEIHAECQLSCGFCEMCKTNKIAMFRNFDFSDMLSFSVFNQLRNVSRECGVFGCFF